MRLRRSVVRGPGLRRVRRGRGILVSQPRRHGGHRRRNVAAHQRPGDPAGLEEGVDLSPSQRAHSGGRHRRRGPPPVHLPPEVAGGARRGEVRPGAGDVHGAVRSGADGSPPISPVVGWSATECWHWRCTCSISATSGPAASSTPRRTIRSASRRCCASTSSCAARRSSSTTPRRAVCVEPWPSTIREAVRAVRGAASPPRPHRSSVGVPQHLGLDRHSRRRPQCQVQGNDRRGLHGQGPPHLAWHGAGGGGLRRCGPAGRTRRWSSVSRPR